MGNVELQQRRDALLLRRQSRVYDVKYRGELRPSKWFVYESAQKRHLIRDYLRGLNVI